MPRYFSQRMLNPYHGIVNVVEITGVDAVCRDGVNWMLYIQGVTEIERWDDGAERKVSLPDIKFGTWSRTAGLKRAAERMADLVQRAAGSPATAQWFLRADDGSGIRLACERQELRGRRLRQDAFPELLLRAEWATSEDTALVAAFHVWQTPWLLALQGISRQTRQWPEGAVCRRALLLDELYPDHPGIIDRSAIKAARVEAALRRSAKTAGREKPTRTPVFVTGN